jgi:hypothetical protein
VKDVRHALLVPEGWETRGPKKSEVLERISQETLGSKDSEVPGENLPGDGTRNVD